MKSINVAFLQGFRQILSTMLTLKAQRHSAQTLLSVTAKSGQIQLHWRHSWKLTHTHIQLIPTCRGTISFTNPLALGNKAGNQSLQKKTLTQRRGYKCHQLGNGGMDFNPERLASPPNSLQSTALWVQWCRQDHFPLQVDQFLCFLCWQVDHTVHFYFNA